jgi:lipopolysaccharide transport protein LptA
MGAKHMPWALWVPVCLLASGCGQSTSVAPAPAPQAVAPAPQRQDEFNQAAYFDAPYYALKKMEIFGKTDSSSLSESGGLLIKDFKINTYRLLTNDPAHVTNALEMIVSAPECLFDQKNSQGSSAGPLTVRTADGRFLIEGAGYLWSQLGANATLAISNNVFTIIKGNPLATNAGGAAVPPESGGQPIQIHSHEFHFDRNANLITYTNQVYAEDGQLGLNCDVMNIHRSPEGSISNLVVDGDIVIVNKSTGGRATGDHAVYTAATGAQLVTLTGNPYWQDGNSEATAQAFIFDRTRQTFRAQGDAHVKLPPSSISDPGFGFMTKPGAETNAPGSSAKPVDVYADDITLQLPATTNGPIRGALAEGNVVITNTEDQSRASGDRADYTGSDGVLVLNGNATWASGQGVVARAAELTFDRTNETFTALTNAYLRFPASTLGQSGAFGNLPARDPRATNQFVEVNSDSYDYRGDALTFHEHVHAGLWDGDARRGTLESGILTVVLQSVPLENGRRTNELESIVAERDVRLRQLPMVAGGKTVEGGLETERLEIQMRTNDLIKTVTATGGVRATRNETPAGGASPVRLALAAEELKATFMPDTNMVQVLVADGQVVATRDEEKASGEHVVYTATNDTAVLTGNPRLEQPGAQTTAEDAIIYDRAHGLIRWTGNPREIFDLSSGSLSQSNLPMLPAKKPNGAPN